MDWSENNRESHESVDHHDLKFSWNESTTTGNHASDKEKSSFHPYWLYFFIVSAMSDFLNSGVLLVICRSRKIRPVSYLLANLSLISISCSVVVCLRVTGWTIPVFQDKVWVCKISSFVISLLLAVIPLSVMGISYERIRSLKVRIGKLIISTTLRWIWGVSIVISIPGLFNAMIADEPLAQPFCKRVPLFGNRAAGIVYEVIRFTVSNLFVSGYLAFELYKVRSKMRYLYIFKQIPTKKIGRKVANVRFAYLYTITFIIIWFPFGCCITLFKIMNPTGSAPKFQQHSIIFDIICILFCLYILLSPVIILCTNEDISDWRKLCNCSKGSSSKKGNRKELAGNGYEDSLSVNVGPTITEARGTTIDNSISELQQSQTDEGNKRTLNDSEEIRSMIFLEMPFSHQN